MGDYQGTFQRVEIKYILNDNQFRDFMRMSGRLAAVDSYGMTSILNIYYDTPDYRLIRCSLDKPVYKEKLRLRTYGIPDDDSKAFVELKKKYDGIVYKRRTEMSYRDARRFMGNGILQHEPTQIEKEIFWFQHFYGHIQPGMVITYDRIAMCGLKDPGLRITFDKDIRWRTDRMDLRFGNDGEDILKPGDRLMELKIGAAMPLELARILDRLEIRQVSFSKYGAGYQMMIKERIDAGEPAVCTAPENKFVRTA